MAKMHMVAFLLFFASGVAAEGLPDQSTTTTNPGSREKVEEKGPRQREETKETKEKPRKKENENPCPNPFKQEREFKDLDPEMQRVILE